MIFIFFNFYFTQCNGCNVGRNPARHDVIVQPIVVIDTNTEKNSQVLGIMLSEVDAPGDRYNGKWIEMTRAVKLCHNKSNGYTYATGFGMNLDGSGDEVKTKITMKDRHAYVFLVLYILFCRKNGREVLKIEDFMGKVDCVSMEYQDD